MATTHEPRSEEQTRVDEKVDDARPVDVQTTETRTTTDPYAGIAAARERFGGVDIPASLVGMLTALSTTLILAGLIGAALGAVDYQTGLEGDARDISTWSMIGGVAVLLVAYIVGGWAAGRMARYDGARNGFRRASGRCYSAASSPRSAPGSAVTTTSSATSTCRSGSRPTP